jgi:prepilin-type N-terminal cleavage/methylation domain-containing protein
MSSSMETRKPIVSTQTEDGFSMLELISVVSILGLIMSALTSAWFVGLRQTRQVSENHDGPRNNNALAFWLASDISSATPVDIATWLNTDPAQTTGCSTTPAGTVNVLRIETRNPRKVSASEQYVASYRFKAATFSTSAQLVRTFCLKGQAPIASGALVEDISAQLLSCGLSVCATVPVTKDRATITFNIAAPGATPYSVSQSAAVRVPEVAPTTAVSNTTTIPPKIPCTFSAASVTPTPPLQVARVSGSGGPGAARPLSAAVAISVTSTGNCTKLVAKVTGESNVPLPPDPTASKIYSCTLLPSGAAWSGGCFQTVAAPHQEFKAQVYTVSIVDRVDDGDLTVTPIDEPTDIPMPFSGTGPVPVLSFSVS